MTHGLFMLDADNRILVVNRKACELLHLSNQEQLKDCELDVVLRYGVRHAFIDGSLPSLIQRQLAQLVDGTLSRSLIQFNEDLYLEFSASRRADGSRHADLRGRDGTHSAPSTRSCTWCGSIR